MGALGVVIHGFIMVIIAICLMSEEANAAQGTAIFYDPPYIPSACYGRQNLGVMVAGASDAIWRNRAACGKNYRVRCIGGANLAPHPCKSGNVVVKIVDYCSSPGCNGTINLSRDAFSKIADLNAGKVKIEYFPA
ncbi:EG45-like domain containing protein [Juglans microcarpa x Juglans regia]|uniref:EG45-like domain containing protein n=1 Tax=Juglans microcarpa x Juglans regia TaxID=2249226 RepID=UPI001B7F727F|nr:EG45-like domain containing protein [Juglans microcarpa x Juglans regia]